MQLGKLWPCPGTCSQTYRNQMSLQGHQRKSKAKNAAGLEGQNKCWQPGYSPS